MIRITAALALALAFAVDARAQIVIRSHLVPNAPRPAGVIPMPALPIAPGALTPPGIVTTTHPDLRHRLLINPYYNVWGYDSYWPSEYESRPTVVNNYVLLPVPLIPPPQPDPPP